MQEKLITRKIVLSMAGVLAAAAFAPEASALPAFARQVGRACSACHMQHFPVLNSYGRDFKASGYTLMGSQKKIKDEHLSIPDTLNAAILVKVRYVKDNTIARDNKATLTPNSLGDGQLQFGDEFSLFFGGRVAENIGFLFEGNTVAGGGQLLAGFKMPFIFNVNETKLGVVPFTTDALGVQYGYELSSGGVLRANRWAEQRRDTSAVQYNADRGVDAGAATGVAFVAQNDLGFINFTKWAPSFAMGGNGSSFASHDFSSNYLRIAATPTMGDWAFVIGAGAMTGTSLTGGVTVAGVPTVGSAALVDTKQTFFDLQAHGLVAGNELGVYLQYANAPATVNGNSYNGAILAAAPVGALAASDRRAWTIGADYSVIPHTLHIGAAYRNAKTGQAINAADVAVGRGVQNNALIVTAVYDLMQNVALHLNHSQYSGNNTNPTAAGVVQPKHATLLMLEGSW